MQVDSDSEEEVTKKTSPKKSSLFPAIDKTDSFKEVKDIENKEENIEEEKLEKNEEKVTKKRTTARKSKKVKEEEEEFNAKEASGESSDDLEEEKIESEDEYEDDDDNKNGKKRKAKSNNLNSSPKKQKLDDELPIPTSAINWVPNQTAPSIPASSQKINIPSITSTPPKIVQLHKPKSPFLINQLEKLQNLQNE